MEQNTAVLGSVVFFCGLLGVRKTNIQTKTSIIQTDNQHKIICRTEQKKMYLCKTKIKY
jgi:hypothetical protein